MIYLHKILPLLISPISLVIVFLIGAIFFKLRIFIVLALITLLISSSNIISNFFLDGLEKSFPKLSLQEVENSDAIVVLSGMIRTIQTNHGLDYDWTDPIDRILTGMDLYHAQKAKRIVLTRGLLPWDMDKPEGENLADFAYKMGIPSDKIILTDKVVNTNEEAGAVFEVLDMNNPKIILVSSAYHLPRAKFLFERQGFEVIPFPTDYRVGFKKFSIIDFIPNTSAMNNFTLYLREKLGYFYYQYIMKR